MEKVTELGEGIQVRVEDNYIVIITPTSLVSLPQDKFRALVAAFVPLIMKGKPS